MPSTTKPAKYQSGREVLSHYITNYQPADADENLDDGWHVSKAKRTVRCLLNELKAELVSESTTSASGRTS